MIALDNNILVYAHREDSPFHQAAFRRVGELAEGLAGLGHPLACVHKFLAVVTHPRIYAPPTPLNYALDQVDTWLESPTLTLLAESTAHWPTLCSMPATGRVAGPLVDDARVAALCCQHGVHELWSVDRDFSRFAGLAVRTR